jgi:hypothetical protein
MFTLKKSGNWYARIEEVKLIESRFLQKAALTTIFAITVVQKVTLKRCISDLEFYIEEIIFLQTWDEPQVSTCLKRFELQKRGLKGIKGNVFA